MGTDRSTVRAAGANAAKRRADAVEPKLDDRSTLLARIGDRLEAQRVELFAFDDDTALLLGRWTALGMPIDVAELHRIPLDWFPWSLGSVRPEEYLFVRNAGLLPMATAPRILGTDLAIGAALMVPLTVGSGAAGALCVYWRDERQSWESSDRELVADWALQAFLPNR